jgi:single-strand DNA-binding protein
MIFLAKKARKKNVNKAILIGRLTREPEIRNTGSTAVAKYTLAVDRRFKREGEASADFINCVVFGKGAEFTEKYLKQGSKIAVVGRIQTGSYKNKDGQTVYTTDIVVEEQEFAESKNSSTPAQNPVVEDKWMSIPEGIDEELPFK